MAVGKILGIAYNQIGEGKDVLFLHGWGSNKECWNGIIPFLSQKYRITAIDFNGFGESDAISAVCSLKDFALRLEFFLGILDIKPYAIVAHSFGGRVAIKMLSGGICKTDKLILVDSGGIIPRRGLKYYMKVYSYKLLKKLKLFFLTNRMGSNDYKVLNGTMRETFVKIVNEDLEVLLPKIQCETLIVWGEKDKETPMYMAKKFNNGIKGSGLVVICGARHFCFIDEPYTFISVVDCFLKSKKENFTCVD